MRTLLRTLAATAALAALVLGAAASTALAASDQASPAQTYRYTFDDTWCFDDGVDIDCSVAHGVISATYMPEGRRAISRIHYALSTVTYDRAGAQIGSSRERSMDRTISVEDGSYTELIIEHHRADGPGYDCQYGYRLKLADFALVAEKFSGPGCSDA